MTTPPRSPFADDLARAAGAGDWAYRLGGGVVGGGADIDQCIGIIIDTDPGEDPLRPEFGAGIWDLLDQPITVVQPEVIRRVTAAVVRWEPRVENVEVTLVPLLAADPAGATWGLAVDYTIVGDPTGATRRHDWRPAR